MNKIVTTTLSLIIGLTFITSSCSEDATAEAKKEAKVESKPITGTFTRIADNDRAGNISGNFTMIHNISFTPQNCSFDCAGVSVTCKYRTENNLVYIETGTELGTLKMEMKSPGVFEGEGWIHGTFSTSGVAINSTGDGDNTDIASNSVDGAQDPVVINTNSNSNTSGSNSSNSSTQNSNTSGNSGTTGNSSTGTVEGEHVSSYETRKLVKLPDFSDVMGMIKSDIKVTLKLALDQKGNVLFASPIASKSTTSDENVLTKVKSLVQQQAKFTPVYTKKTMEIEYSFTIKK